MALPKLSTAFYETIIPSSKVKVRFRPMTTKEEKSLLLAKEDENPKTGMLAVKNLIEACVEGVPVSNLTMPDIEWIFVQIRMKSQKEVIDMKVACEKCGTMVETKYDLRNIRAEGGPKNQKEYEKFSKVMLDDSVGITLKFPTFDTVVSAMTEKNEGETITQYDLIDRCIVNVFDSESVYDTENLSASEISEFTDQFTAVHKEKIKEFMDLLPVIKGEIEYTCSCEPKYSGKKEVVGLEAFFS